MRPMTPIEQARAILGEHYRNYVVVVQDYDNPTSFDVLFSDPFAAHGLLSSANNYHEQYLNAGLEDLEEEWVWEDEEEDEQEWD